MKSWIKCCSCSIFVEMAMNDGNYTYSEKIVSNHTRLPTICTKKFTANGFNKSQSVYYNCDRFFVCMVVYLPESGTKTFQIQCSNGRVESLHVCNCNFWCFRLNVCNEWNCIVWRRYTIHEMNTILYMMNRAKPFDT